MTVATINYTTAGTSVNKAYRKIQGPMLVAFQKKTEEWDLFGDLPEQDITFSAREMTVPVDLNPAAGTAMIGEAGTEGITYTPNLEEITLTWVNLNHRWTTSLTAKYLDASAKDGMVIRQLKYQAMKAIESISNRVGQQFYGFSTGTVCKISNVVTATTATLTLIDAYGDANLDDTTFLQNMIQVGDQIALVRSSTLVTNAVGEVTSNATAGVIVVVFAGSVTTAANDIVVFANSAISTATSTLADGSDQNRWPVGLKDACETASVHSLSSASVPRWAASTNSSTAQRYSFILERKAQQGIQNKGGGRADLRIWANGVENDVIDGERAALRFSDASNLQFDGALKTKGMKVFTSRHVPNGHVWLLDRGSSVKKFSLVKMPSEDAPAWGDGDKAEDRNALKFSIDFPYALVHTNRANVAQYRALTEQ